MILGIIMITVRAILAIIIMTPNTVSNKSGTKASGSNNNPKKTIAGLMQ